ncbi:MAG: RHS repeat-associated core domain-containing protein [Verrucomicrobia bacterium]|nr:RHS repeat-associated core domain-containing protein [Verrucomicrobiota bacterium]
MFSYGRVISETRKDTSGNVVGSTTYTYDSHGRLASATDSLGRTTSWSYNNADQVLCVTSPAPGNGQTPQVTLTFYDLLGRACGTLSALSMSWAYDNKLRLSTVTAKNGSSVIGSAGYGYDAAGRLGTVIEGAFRADYRYEPGSGLLSTVAMTNNGTGVGLVTGRVYDGLGRVSLISSKAYGPQAAGLPLSCGYQYNAANQRTRMVLADGSWWEYRYDRLGQVISGKRYWPDGTPVAGQQFEYAFDDIGNRRSVATGGDRDGSDLRTSTYTVNRLNQYRDRPVPAQVDVLGIADPAAHVTVNGNSAYRKGEYFHHALVVPNSTAQYAEVTVISGAGGGQSRTGKVYLPPATETFSYDADGNLVSDGRWKYSWDGENRLVEMIRDTDNPAGARQRLVFEYDHQGRRIRKQFFTYNGDWQKQSDVVFLYDGWNLVAELDANASNAKVRTYVWGSDLSGSMQGAGGIGGLLKVTQHGSQVTHHFVAYDGNGNVMGLVNTADGSLSARYEYGPFGEPIRISGAISILNPIRFSSKYTDDQSGLVYYGYRYYNPSTGRWINRDPIGELGGKSIYGFVKNDVCGLVDPYGLMWVVRKVSGEPFPDASASVFRWLADQVSLFIRSAVTDSSVWVHSEGGYFGLFSRIEKFFGDQWPLVADARVDLACDKNGNIIAESSEATLARNGISVAARATVSKVGRTASVSFTAAASFVGKLAIKLGGGPKGGVEMGLEMNASDLTISRVGAATFECQCENPQRL